MTAAERQMIAYLLGELSDDERDGFERSYFSDVSRFDRLLEAETTLIDEYVGGRLDPDARARFERVYLADSRRRFRVRFAEALAVVGGRHGQAETRAERRHPFRVWERFAWWPAAASAAAALLVLVAGALWLQTIRLRDRADRADAARGAAEHEFQRQLSSERAANEELRARLNRMASAENNRSQTIEPPPAERPLIVSLLLHANAERGANVGRVPVLRIPPRAAQARLVLAIDSAEYTAYEVSVRTAGGATVYLAHGVRPTHTSSGFRFAALIAADRLTDGDYVLTLRGVDGGVGAEAEDVAELIFRVERP